jgi:hypothetical protein
MSITPADLCQVGDTLLAAADEPHQRSAMSRHYYGAYHRCVAWAETLPHLGHASLGPAGGKHQQFVNQLKNPDSQCSDDEKKKSRRIGALLDVLRIRRAAADYNISDPMAAGDPSLQAVQAKNLIGICDQP